MDSGVDISASELPELLRSYISSLPSPPDSWISLGPFLGGIKNSVSDLR
jgi:glutaminyl-tRNA synthetase